MTVEELLANQRAAIKEGIQRYHEKYPYSFDKKDMQQLIEELGL
jgi:hypothetical protein